MNTVNFTQPKPGVWESGYLRFEDLGKTEGRVTRKYAVIGALNSDTLGWIEWKSSWRRYTFRPATGCSTWFDALCLTAIGEFVRIRTDERKAHWGTQGRFANR